MTGADDYLDVPPDPDPTAPLLAGDGTAGPVDDWPDLEVADDPVPPGARIADAPLVCPSCRGRFHDRGPSDGVDLYQCECGWVGHWPPPSEAPVAAYVPATIQAENILDMVRESLGRVRRLRALLNAALAGEREAVSLLQAGRTGDAVALLLASVRGLDAALRDGRP